MVQRFNESDPDSPQALEHLINNVLDFAAMTSRNSYARRITEGHSPQHSTSLGTTPVPRPKDGRRPHVGKQRAYILITTNKILEQIAKPDMYVTIKQREDS